MSKYFFPNFRVTVVRADEHEVRIHGHNNYRLMVITYGASFVVLLVLFGWLASFIEGSGIWIVGAIAIGGLGIFASKVFGVQARHRHYVKDEIRFDENGVWARVGLDGQTTQEVRPTDYLSIYQKDPRLKFFKPQYSSSLFEFELAYRENISKFIQNMAGAMQMELEKSVTHSEGNKYILRPLGSPLKKGFRRSFEMNLFISHNNHIQRKYHDDGRVEYSAEGGVLLSRQVIEISKDAQIVRVKNNIWGWKTIVIPARAKLNTSYFLHDLEYDNSGYNVGITAYLQVNGYARKLFVIKLEAPRESLRQKLDLIEDVQFFLEDLLAQLQGEVKKRVHAT